MKILMASFVLFYLDCFTGRFYLDLPADLFPHNYPTLASEWQSETATLLNLMTRI